MGYGSLGFLEAIGELLDITYNLFKWSSSSFALSIDMVKLVLQDGVRLLGVGAGGAGIEEQRDAGCVKCVDILGSVMINTGAAEGLEVITSG